MVWFALGSKQLHSGGFVKRDLVSEAFWHVDAGWIRLVEVTCVEVSPVPASATYVFVLADSAFSLKIILVSDICVEF